MVYSYITYIPVYESYETMIVVVKDSGSSANQPYMDILMGQQLVKEFKEIIKSRKVLQSVIDELMLKNMSYEALADNVSVALKDNTRILTIKVRDGDPGRTKILTEKVCDVFIGEVSKIVKVDNVEIIDTAQLPREPVKADVNKKLLVALIIGLVAASGIIFVLEELDDTIKTAEDVERIFGLKVLGTIPTLKHGKGD